MNETKYLETQHQVQLFAGLLKGLDLDDFLATLERGESTGMVLDPTLYREALQSGKLDLIKGVALALRGAQRAIGKAEAEYRESVGEEAPDVTAILEQIEASARAYKHPDDDTVDEAKTSPGPDAGCM